MLLDWLGSRTMESNLLAAARAAGCDVQIYHPPSWYHLGRLNNRTHRKIMVVDGKIGFTGGVGMGTEWREGLNGLPPWRETHFKAEGPVVAQMQAVFIDNWIKATGRVLHGAEYFPKLSATCGDMEAQMFGSSPVGGSESMHLMVLLALTAAKTSIDIENAYFVPDRLTVEALCSAARRGVRVRIVVPGRHTDARIGRWAAQGLYGELLRSGIQIYEYQPTMMHCKVLVIDGVWSSVGSANFDDRSFRLNDEANLNVFSEDLAREQLAAHRRRHPAIAAHGVAASGATGSSAGASTSAWRCCCVRSSNGDIPDLLAKGDGVRYVTGRPPFASNRILSRRSRSCPAYSLWNARCCDPCNAGLRDSRCRNSAEPRLNA